MDAISSMFLAAAAAASPPLRRLLAVGSELTAGIAAARGPALPLYGRLLAELYCEALFASV